MSAAASTGFACAACTFENASGSACEMCGTDRPAPAAEAQPPPEGKAAAEEAAAAELPRDVVAEIRAATNREELQDVLSTLADDIENCRVTLAKADLIAAAKAAKTTDANVWGKGVAAEFGAALKAFPKGGAVEFKAPSGAVDLSRRTHDFDENGVVFWVATKGAVRWCVARWCVWRSVAVLMLVYGAAVWWWRWWWWW